MSGSFTMTNKESARGGVTILDEDNQPIEKISDIPGASIEFVSSDPSVLGVEVDSDGLHVKALSLKNGNATFSVIPHGLTKPNGTPFETDVTSVTVKNSAPNSLNFTFSAPEPE